MSKELDEIDLLIKAVTLEPHINSRLARDLKKVFGEKAELDCYCPSIIGFLDIKHAYNTDSKTGCTPDSLWHRARGYDVMEMHNAGRAVSELYSTKIYELPTHKIYTAAARKKDLRQLANYA